MFNKLNRFERVYVLAILGTVALIVVVPLLFMLINTFKPPGEALLHPFSIPKDLTGISYVRVWPYMQTALFNSLKVTFGSVAMLVFLSPLVSYVLAFEDFKGKTLVTLLSLFGIFAIPVAGLIPILLTLKNMGLMNTHLGLMFVYFGLYYPTAVFIVREFYNSFPDSLWEAAELDGLS
ncbi:MAG: carbohydrate ABC transporter permease, partial [Candidatus Bipolaricaulia bacterium]